MTTDTDADADASLGLVLCRLAMGMDALYRRTRSSTGEAALASEGLVPVDLWRGEPLELSDWSAATAVIHTLLDQLPTVADPVRRTYLEDTLISLSTTAAWQRGEPMPFRERAARMLRLDIEPIPMYVLDEWRTRVRAAHASESARSLPREDLADAFTELLREAHQRATTRIGALPPRPLMRLELVRDVPYTAYCDYPSNTMRLNGDQPFSRERLKLLVLHEAYPGHDFHLAWRERDARAGVQPPDSLLVITNTPSSPLFEGIGDNGACFLDWLSEAEAADVELATLRSAACVNACLMLHESGESPARVRDFLVEQGLGLPAWAETRLRFMHDPLRAPFVFSYYLGFLSVSEASAAWTGPRADFFTCLYGQMHSPRSLRLAVELANRRTS